MKSYNIQNYIRYKQDLEATLKRLNKKDLIKKESTYSEESK